MEGMSGTILVAEADAALARSISRRLEADGHTVEVVGSVREARTRLREQTPDLLVLDVALETDGLEFFQALRFAPENPRAGVVVLTDPSDVHRRERAHQLGAAAVLTRPPRPERLSEVVAGLLAVM